MRKIIFAAGVTVMLTAQLFADPAANPRLQQMISRNDSDKDGKISRNEYPWRKDIFDKLDTDSDGYLTPEELAQALAKRRPAINADIIRNIQYAEVDGKKIQLDLYLPKDRKAPPVLLVWIHGGGWVNGSKNNVNPAFLDLIKKGYAIASIDYQLLGISGLHQIIMECKGAIRFLRANATKYGYNAEKIGVGGSSAGGHLVLILGTSGGAKELEGDVGGNLNQSSSVQAVVDLFGPSDMEKQVRKRHKQNDPDFDAKAKLVSPVTYVGKNDPPLLIYHGTADPVVPIEQSRIIDKKYKEAGLESIKIEIKDGKHGFKPSEFDRKTETERMAKFFNKHLK